MRKTILALWALLLISACGRMPPTSEFTKGYVVNDQSEPIALDSLVAASYYSDLDTKFISLLAASADFFDSQENAVTMPARGQWAVLNQVRYRYSIQKTRYEQVSWIEFRVVDPEQGIQEIFRFSYPVKARCGSIRYRFSAATYRALPSQSEIINRFGWLVSIMSQIDNASIRVDG